MTKDTDEGDTPQEPSANDGETVDNDLSDAEGGGPPDASEGGTTQDAPSPGHGRYRADDYPGAKQVDILHAQLCKGDDCPTCQRGTLYEKAPSLFVRFIGQAPLQATAYCLQRLRCNLCGKVFTASPPDEMGQQKYDHTVASMIGLLKYGSGLPFNRVQRLQGSFKIPLAASTQWGIIKAAALLMAIAFEELIRQTPSLPSYNGVANLGRQHFLYFFPLPHGQAALRPTLTVAGCWSTALSQRISSALGPLTVRWANEPDGRASMLR